MEDLVAGVVDLALTGDGAKDARVGERPQDRLDVLLAGACVRGQVADAVCDLRPGRRDEVVEHLRRPRLLRRLERGERAAKVVPHDLLGAAELRERGSSQHGRPLAALHLPETPKDELEVRRFHLIPIAVQIGHAPDPHLSRPHLARCEPGRARPRRAVPRPSPAPRPARAGRRARAASRWRRARPSRDRGSSLIRFSKSPGRCPLKRWRSASASSRSAMRKFTRERGVARGFDEHGRDGGLDPQARLVDEQLLELVEDDEHLAVVGCQRSARPSRPATRRPEPADRRRRPTRRRGSPRRARSRNRPATTRRRRRRAAASLRESARARHDRAEPARRRRGAASSSPRRWRRRAGSHGPP